MYLMGWPYVSSDCQLYIYSTNIFVIHYFIDYMNNSVILLGGKKLLNTFTSKLEDLGRELKY